MAEPQPYLFVFWFPHCCLLVVVVVVYKFKPRCWVRLSFSSFPRVSQSQSQSQSQPLAHSSSHTPAACRRSPPAAPNPLFRDGFAVASDRSIHIAPRLFPLSPIPSRGQPSQSQPPFFLLLRSPHRAKSLAAKAFLTSSARGVLNASRDSPSSPPEKAPLAASRPVLAFGGGRLHKADGKASCPWGFPPPVQARICRSGDARGRGVSMDVRALMSDSVRSMRAAALPLIARAAVLLLLSALPLSQPYTYEQDVFAINGLYTALGSPTLPGWVTNGGDPCTENWQGVGCAESNITTITLNGMSLGGQLGNTLENFTSLITLDLSNNNIGGTIPDSLPVTVQRFNLSVNQLTGSIPSTLSTLTLLTVMYLNNNQLVGEIPDVFSALTGLANLDFSSNNLTGPLPSSVGNLTALTSLHIQNNQLSGTLDVLQNLPLQDLNIQNNLFSGPVPAKLYTIPNFQKDGNPFNTTIAPSPLPAAPAPSPSLSPSTGHVPSKEPTKSSDGTNGNSPASGKHTFWTVKSIGYILVGVVSAVAVVLMVMFCVSKYKERKSKNDVYTKSHIGREPQRLGEPKIKEVPEIKEHLVKPKNTVVKASNVVSNSKEELKVNASIKAPNVVYNAKEATLYPPMRAAYGLITKKQKEHVIDMEKSDDFVEEPLHFPQSVAPRIEKAIVAPSVRTKKGRVPSLGKIDLKTTVKSFSVASLQQYTNSFSEENLIRDSRFGRVYLAELPDGEILEVLKIDIDNSRVPVDVFLELVVNISELSHPNILELVGYCAEFEQRLLVYEHCSKMTLHDELHYVDEPSNALSWNARLQVAVEAAKALQYLHDGCQPPLVHQNFEPSIILLNSTLSVQISECGLASLSQLSGSLRALFHYEAPEVHESRTFSDRSDVYSFGVVMLELLTGRKPYDSSRPRAEQHLVRWASTQLYGIDTISKMVDPCIRGQCSEKALSRFADVISRCIQHEPEFRPPISEIVQDLIRMVGDATKASM